MLAFEEKGKKLVYPEKNLLELGREHMMLSQMKATEQYFPVVLFIMLYKVVLSFESVDDESY